MSTIPKDPFMLLSNMHLRDDGMSLDELCKSLDIDRDNLVKTLKDAGFDYLPEVNQFR